MHPIDEYVHKVLSGDIPACKLIKQACQRHKKDLERDDIYFDYESADKVIDFFPLFLKHIKGDLAGKPFELMLWMKFVVGSLYGWKKTATGTRKYKVAYIEVPRKNSKTTLMAGMAIYALGYDGEGGAEVYSAATKSDQARICFELAKNMIQRDEDLSEKITCYAHSLFILSEASSFKPLASDSKSLDGLNTHFCCVDELHAHKDRHIWEVIESSTGSRTQPLIVAITTAGDDKTGICYEQHDYSRKILSNIVNDDEFFCFIATIDDGDDWRNPEVWAKANPSWGEAVKPEMVHGKFIKANVTPSAQNTFKRYYLNVWTESTTAWITDTQWDECNKGFISDEDLAGRKCYLGMDLSSTGDITAVVAWFPPQKPNEDWILRPWFFVPAESLVQRSKEDKVPYDVWHKAGWIFDTEGNAVDYDVIEEYIRNTISKQFDVLEIMYDRFFSQSIINHLTDDGFNMIPVTQNIGGMTSPTKELERLILERKMNHMGNPVLAWMMSNTEVYVDANENMRPVKGNNRKKRIDGIVAAIIGLSRAMLLEEKKKSVYEERGVRVL